MLPAGAMALALLGLHNAAPSGVAITPGQGHHAAQIR